MRLALLALSVPSAFAVSYAAVAANASCENGVGCAGYYRAFVAVTTPLGSVFEPESNVTGISVAAIGVQAKGDGTVANGRVDVAGLKFKTPADHSDAGQNPSLSFYFAYLGAQGTWDNSTQTATAGISAVEIVSSFSSVQIYYDRDGTDGFNWNLADGSVDIFDCTKTNDCVDQAGSIDMANLTWTPINRNVTMCTSVLPDGNYSANCTIQTFTTTGFLNSAAVVAITARTASQKLNIDGLAHGPDNCKFDVKVNYPWAQKTLANASIAKVALVALHGGRAAAAGGVATVNNGVTKSLTFAASKGKSSYFGYTSTALIDGATSAIITQTITGEDIMDYKGQGLTATNLFVTLVLKPIVVWLGTQSWKVQITIHSFTKTGAVDIFWDPEVGVTDATSGAMMFVPSVLAVLFAALLM